MKPYCLSFYIRETVPVIEWERKWLVFKWPKIVMKERIQRRHYECDKELAEAFIRCEKSAKAWLLLYFPTAHWLQLEHSSTGSFGSSYIPTAGYVTEPAVTNLCRASDLTHAAWKKR